MAKKRKKKHGGSGRIAVILALVLIISALGYRAHQNGTLQLPQQDGSMVTMVDAFFDRLRLEEKLAALLEKGEDLVGSLREKAADTWNDLLGKAGKPAAEESGEPEKTVITLDTLPEFSGVPYVELEGNLPAFTAESMTATAYEVYSPLDLLGRCGVAKACLGPELMPTEERGPIGMVKPSGWQTVRYDDRIEGKYLYNRCHLIGYQLAGENANEMNLITGTRYLNVEGMLPFENQVADYVRETGNHVLYRVTPVFRGVELVARGVQMEAYSVEDEGAGICFNVYCYNVQPGVEIEYLSGTSRAEEGYVP